MKREEVKAMKQSELNINIYFGLIVVWLLHREHNRVKDFFGMK